jgi:hypothetical protein
VWRWQCRFAEQGVRALLRDKTRPPGTLPLPADTVARVAWPQSLYLRADQFTSFLPGHVVRYVRV